MSELITDEQIKNNIRAKKRRKKTMQRVIVVFLALVLAVVDGYLLGKAVGNRMYEKESDQPTAVVADMPIINTAMKEIGNKGGEKFWSWYGFDSHVAWCACYVSWCESKNGYISNKWAPKFAGCTTAVEWFKKKGQWHKPDETPEAGDIIFFDWEQDGGVDHVGIVTGVTDDQIYTIEGNSSDRCRQKRYYIGDQVIFGFGHPKTT